MAYRFQRFAPFRGAAYPAPRLALSLFITVAAAALVAGCGSSKDAKLGVSASKRVVEYGQPVPKGGGVYKIGSPYKVAGKWYYPKEDPGYTGVGMASWYGDDFHGRYTANGEIYDMDTLSAAHPTLPLPTYAKVRNLENGKEIVVRVNDRGPYAHGREIDLSKRAAEVLGFRHKGLTKVQVSYLGRAPLEGGDGWDTSVQYAQKQDRQPLAPAPAGTAAPAQPIRVASAGPLPAGSFPEPVATQPAARQPLAAVSADTVFVQAGSFRDAGNAERLGGTLTRYGQVDIAQVGVGGMTYFRVRVGPFADASQAQSALHGALSAGADGAKLVVVK